MLPSINWRQALDLTKQVMAAGLTPSVPTLSRLFGRVDEQGLLKEALAVLEEALEKMVEAYGGDIETKLLTSLIQSCKAVGDLDAAHEVLALAAKNGVAGTPTLYNAIIEACGALGDAEKAFALVAKMPDDGVEPSAFTYNALLTACCTAPGAAPRGAEALVLGRSAGSLPAPSTLAAWLRALAAGGGALPTTVWPAALEALKASGGGDGAAAAADVVQAADELLKAKGAALWPAPPKETADAIAALRAAVAKGGAG